MNRAMFSFARASTALVPVLALAAASCGIDDDSIAGDPGATAPGDPAAIHPEPGPIGQVGADMPLAGTDFDGDGRADFAIYRPSDHTYRILLSNTNYTGSSTFAFGAGADQPLGR